MKRRVLTGITTTGAPHLGNYVGAIRPAIAASRSEAVESYYFLADYHALVKCQDPDRIQRSTLEIAATWLALGLDPRRVLFYRQSDIPEIPELTWLLTCVAGKGLLNRAHAYKASVDANVQAGDDPDAGISAGLFMYPVLMAADILAYKATHVPVGEDQKQHLELARDIASTFNTRYKVDHFIQPEPYIMGAATRVMSLRDGTQKMSKSAESDLSRINLTDDADAIANKIKRAKTDSEPLPDNMNALKTRPEALNLVTIYAALADKSPEKILNQFAGKQFSEFKPKLSELAVSKLAPITARMNELMSDKEEIDRILAKGAQRARAVAEPVLKETMDIMGFWKAP